MNFNEMKINEMMINEMMINEMMINEIDDKRVQDAMDWFASFYITKAMFETGRYKVIHPSYVSKAGAVYLFDEETMQYDKEQIEFLKTMDEIESEEEKEEYKEYTPFLPLNPWTWSFDIGPMEEYHHHEQVSKFDTTTLTKIVGNFTDPIPTSGIPLDHLSLVELVQEIIHKEYNLAEMSIENHPVLQLTSGILCQQNWKLLSRADSEKFKNAHMAYSIENVIEKQIDMLQEMVEKRYTSSCRDYDTTRGILQSNKVSLGISTTIEDEPVGSIREQPSSLIS